MTFPWPPCAKTGCPWPGILKIKMTDEHGPLAAYLCPLCVGQAPALLEEMAAVRRERIRLLPGTPETDAEEEKTQA